MKLALGTVQFGMAYGVANQMGQVSLDEVSKILQIAEAAGIDTIDTAIAYGDAESRLGAAGVSKFSVVSKLPGFKGNVDQVEELVSQSLQRLGVPKLSALLLHRSQDLSDRKLFARLIAMKDKGLVGKLGVSIYDPAELNALSADYRLDIVQAPLNVFDRRIISSGALARLKDAGVEVHTRSIFLQGLLLMRPAARPAYFARWRPLLDKWDKWLEETGASPLSAALSVALNNPMVDRLVIGIDSCEHLQEVLTASPACDRVPPEDLATNETDLIDPSKWKTK